MDGINWTAARFFFDLVQVGAILAIGIYSWWKANHQTNSTEMNKIKERVERNDRRIERVEQDLTNQPSHAHVSKLRNEMSQLGKEIAEMTGTMKGMNSQLTLVTQHLMGGKVE